MGPMLVERLSRNQAVSGSLRSTEPIAISGQLAIK
jgi:hypothetical protein